MIGWLGASMIGLALLAALLEKTFRRQRAWDRPAWTRTASYRRLFQPSWLLILVTGIGLVASASWQAAAVIAALLVGLDLLRRRVRSPSVVAARIEARASRIAASRPGTSTVEAKIAAILERHPEWGRELAGRIVEDAESTQSLGRIVSRMERGWPGA